MPSKSQLYAAIGIAALVWAVLLIVQGASLKATYLRPYSFAVGVVIICFLVFDRWLWRVAARLRLIRRPVLRGTWKGRLTSMWEDPATGQRPPEIEIYLAVHQTYSTMSLVLLTKESASRSVVAGLAVPSDQPATISSTYLNVPRLRVRERSPIHHGALMLDVEGLPARRMSGSYWTERNSRGEVSFDARSTRVHGDFATAKADTYG